MSEGINVRPTVVAAFVTAGVLPLLGSQLQQDLGWTFTLPLVGCGVVAGLWAGVRTSYSDHLHRWGYPALIVTYVILLLCLTALRNVPAIWAIVPPVALWAGAVTILVRSPDANQHEQLAESGFRVAILGLGIVGLIRGIKAVVASSWLEASSLLGCSVAVLLYSALSFARLSPRVRSVGVAAAIMGTAVAVAVQTIGGEYGDLNVATPIVFAVWMAVLAIALLLNLRKPSGVLTAIMGLSAAGSAVIFTADDAGILSIGGSVSLAFAGIGGGIALYRGSRRIARAVVAIGLGLTFIAVALLQYEVNSLSPGLVALGVGAVGYGFSRFGHEKPTLACACVLSGLSALLVLILQTAHSTDVEWMLGITTVVLFVGTGTVLLLDSDLLTITYIHCASAIFIILGVSDLIQREFDLGVPVIVAGLIGTAIAQFGWRHRSIL